MRFPVMGVVKFLIEYSVFTVVLIEVTNGQVLHVSTQENYNALGFNGTLPSFDKLLYIAYIENGLFSTNETILLEDCHNVKDLFLKVTYDRNKYYPIYPIIRGCSVYLDYVYIRKEISIDEHFLDIITLQSYTKTKEGIDCLLSETHVAVLGLPVDDPEECGSCVEQFSDNEYVVLNYFYFKVFLFLIACTGLFLLIIQLKEICSLGKHINYRSLNDNCNYI